MKILNNCMIRLETKRELLNGRIAYKIFQKYKQAIPETLVFACLRSS